MKCPVCDGEGGWGEDFGEGTFTFEDCLYCKGKEKISLFRWAGFHFWGVMPEWVWDLYIWIVYKESEK